jgi:hypothetical protein
MTKLITRPVSEVDSYVTQTWLLKDQKAGFGAIQSLTTQVAVSQHIQTLLTSEGVITDNLKAGIFIQDPEITALFLLQSMEFAQRGLCNAAGNYLLASEGMETWARVTNYYASYFCVHSMLALQGRAITQIELAGSKSKILVQPIDFQNNIYAVTSRHLGKNPHHETPWRRYYEIYDRYASGSVDYEVIMRKAHVQDPTDESVQRNLINYTPFQGFHEVISAGQRRGFSEGFELHDSSIVQDASLLAIRRNLSALSSDPDFRYFARSFLKILYIYEVLNDLAGNNTTIKSHWTALKREWLDFLKEIEGDRPTGTSLRIAIEHLT